MVGFVREGRKSGKRFNERINAEKELMAKVAAKKAAKEAAAKQGKTPISLRFRPQHSPQALAPSPRIQAARAS